MRPPIDSRRMPVLLPQAPNNTDGLLAWARGLMVALNTERRKQAELPFALVIGDVDIEITDPTRGIILTSPDGTRWRITIDDMGTISGVSL